MSGCSLVTRKERDIIAGPDRVSDPSAEGGRADGGRDLAPSCLHTGRQCECDDAGLCARTGRGMGALVKRPEAVCFCRRSFIGRERAVRKRCFFCAQHAYAKK